ncbi:NAD-dependent epimerase/dehydratase family protein [Methanoregula sp.]|uniref:NAD-dependent epimerase/dehydratase family protein n=1 Tax=Methanoregula sp. TaxID=2052170 RepID=UPI003C7147E1
MRLLVTGASGFTGTALIRFLSPYEDIQITGITRDKVTRPSGGPGGVTWVTADLLDRDHLCRLVASLQPDAVIHLAGMNHGSPAELFMANICGTQNLLEAVSGIKRDCRVLVTSSSAVYGYQGSSPINEENPFQPLNEYGAAKTAQEILAVMHYRALGISVTIARPFNLAGPGQAHAFLCGKLVSQVVEFGQGKRKALDLFETQSSRDFVDVRDAVKAYWALVTHPRFMEDCAGNAFNIGSGRSYAISEVIATLEKITGRKYPVSLPADPQRVALLSQQSDISRIHRVTGWKPEISLEETLRDMLAAEQARIAA